MTRNEAPIARPTERLSRARQRQKLIEACITALHQHGPSRTTIDKVVSIADMSPGIVNFYFETKAALLVAALEHLAVEFETAVLEPIAALQSAPLAALDRLIELYLDPELASARKVSVWYSFWGESSSRREYYTICGKRDVAFATLVRNLVGRVIRQTQLTHLDADAISLGLIGCLEMMWQDIAFQDEGNVDREMAKSRCRAYLRSVFPSRVRQALGILAPLPEAAYASHAVFSAETAMFRRHWHFACSVEDVSQPGDYVAWQSAVDRTVIVRGADSAVRAFANTCLHRPHALVEGDAGHLHGDIVCAADGSVYGLDGVLRAGGAALAQLRLCADRLAIYVTHEADGSDVPVIAVDGFVPAGAWRHFDVAADWKIVVEHWADAYFDTAGRGFLRNQPVVSGEARAGSVSLMQNLAGEAASVTAALYLGLLPKLTVVPLERRLIWPNLFVETRPDGMTVRQVLPLGPGRARVRVRRYQRPSPDRIARSLSYLAVRIERVWERDDARAIESTFPGAGIPTGPTTESFLHWLRTAIPVAYD